MSSSVLESNVTTANWGAGWLWTQIYINWFNALFLAFVLWIAVGDICLLLTIVSWLVFIRWQLRHPASDIEIDEMSMCGDFEKDEIVSTICFGPCIRRIFITGSWTISTWREVLLPPRPSTALHRPCCHPPPPPPPPPHRRYLTPPHLWLCVMKYST